MTFVNLHAIEQMQLRGRRRVDGVGRPKFDSTQVAPKQNRLAVFRGDAEHAVRRVTNVTKADASFPKGHRVSLVLEQYRVPPGLREFTMHFEIVEGKDYERVSD